MNIDRDLVVEGFDWTRALDAMGGGHNLATVDRVRGMMAAVGVTGLPLSPEEQREVKRLRSAAQLNLAAAEAIERRAHPDA